MKLPFFVYLMVSFVFFVLLPSTLNVAVEGHFHGSKTPYEQTPTDWQRLLVNEAGLSPTCKLVHLRTIARHGVRSPDLRNIRAVRKAIMRFIEAEKFFKIEKGQSKTADKLRKVILDWHSKLPEGKQLMTRGMKEHEFLAREFFRLIDFHSSILSRKNVVYFQSTEIPRAFDSAEAFRHEWIRLIESANLLIPMEDIQISDVVKNDDRLYLHKNCPAFDKLVLQNPAMGEETRRIRWTAEAAALIEKINKEKLGFPTNVLQWSKFSLFDSILLGKFCF